MDESFHVQTEKQELLVVYSAVLIHISSFECAFPRQRIHSHSTAWKFLHALHEFLFLQIAFPLHVKAVKDRGGLSVLVLADFQPAQDLQEAELREFELHVLVGEQLAHFHDGPFHLPFVLRHVERRLVNSLPVLLVEPRVREQRACVRPLILVLFEAHFYEVAGVWAVYEELVLLKIGLGSKNFQMKVTVVARLERSKASEQLISEAAERPDIDP